MSASQAGVYQLVRQPAAIGVPEDSIPGRRRTTSNFDRPKGFGQANQDNFDTSDSWRFPPEFSIRAQDLLLIDGEDWMTVAGDPMQKARIPRGVAFITTTTPPRIAPGYWGE